MCVHISAQRVSYSGTSARAPSVDGPLISFRIVSSAFKLLLHPDSVSSFVWSRYGVLFWNWTLSTRLLEKQADYQPRLIYIGGSGGMLPGKKFGEFDSLKRHILHSLDRTQLIYKCILSQSLVIHDSQAEVQRFMILKFLTQRFMILTCFASMIIIHDSTSTPVYWNIWINNLNFYHFLQFTVGKSRVDNHLIIF